MSSDPYPHLSDESVMALLSRLGDDDPQMGMWIIRELNTPVPGTLVKQSPRSVLHTAELMTRVKIVDVTPTKLTTKRRSRPPLRLLIRAADFVGLKARKQIKAMAGDMDFEIRRLRRQRRPFAVRWNIAQAWFYAAQIVLRGPLESLVRLIRRQLFG